MRQGIGHLGLIFWNYHKGLKVFETPMAQVTNVMKFCCCETVDKYSVWVPSCKPLRENINPV